VGEVERPLQAKRDEDALFHRRLEPHAGDHLDDAAGNTEAAVAIAPEFAGRGLLCPLTGSGDIPLHRVVAFPRVFEPVALQTARVGK
jgi:hypothetical protein